MLDHLTEVACSGWSLATVALASTLNAVVGVLAVVFAAEVNDGVLAGAALFVLGTATGILGWALVLVVKLSNVVSKLEATSDDHERRLTAGGI